MKGSTGAVVRDAHGVFLAAACSTDAHGVFLAAACSTIQHVDAAQTAEAIAMHQGLLLANTLGLNSIEVVNACAGYDRIWNKASAIYADCFIMAGMIGRVDFLHCVRETNEVAHSLAKFAYENDTSISWFEEAPDFFGECHCKRCNYFTSEIK